MRRSSLRRAEVEKGKDACQIRPVDGPFVRAAGETRPGISQKQMMMYVGRPHWYNPYAEIPSLAFDGKDDLCHEGFLFLPCNN